MLTFRVKHNFSVYQPRWAGDYVRIFGANNEGFTLQAADLQDAKRILRDERRLNPFYLTIKQEA